MVYWAAEQQFSWIIAPWWLSVSLWRIFITFEWPRYVCMYEFIFRDFLTLHIWKYILLIYSATMPTEWLCILLLLPRSSLSAVIRSFSTIFDYFIRLDAWALHILISCDLSIFSRVYYLWDRIRRSIRYLRCWGVVGLAAIVIISRWGWDFYFFSVSRSGVDSRPPGAPGLLPLEFVCHPIGFGA